MTLFQLEIISDSALDGSTTFKRQVSANALNSAMNTFIEHFKHQGVIAGKRKYRYMNHRPISCTQLVPCMLWKIKFSYFINMVWKLFIFFKVFDAISNGVGSFFSLQLSIFGNFMAALCLIFTILPALFWVSYSDSTNDKIEFNSSWSAVNFDIFSGVYTPTAESRELSSCPLLN